MTLTLLTVLVFAVAADFREMRISNRLIASGLMMGLAHSGGRRCGHCSFPGEHFYSGYLIVSFISTACNWRRRYQVIFRSWWISFNETVVICHTGGICGGSSNWTGEAAVSEANGGNIRESENTDSFFSDDFNWIFYCSLGVCH